MLTISPTFLLVFVACWCKTDSTCTNDTPLFEHLIRVPLATATKSAWKGEHPTIFEINRSTTEWQALSSTWATEQFLTSFGSTLVHTTTPFEVARYGASSKDLSGRPMTVRNIIASTTEASTNDDLMIFANENTRLTQLVLASGLPASLWLQRSPFSQQQVAVESFVSIARKLQGLPFHKHGKTCLTLVTGTKDWLIASPKTRLDEKMLWTSNSSEYCPPSMPNASIRLVRQQAGEMFCLPKGWWHATVNRDKEVSLGIVQNYYGGEENKNTRLHGSGSRDAENFLYDDPFFEAQENIHFKKVLVEADQLLLDKKINRSEASALRWTTRRKAWQQQLERAVDAYFHRAASIDARRPELCLYVMQVAVGSAVDRLARERDTSFVASSSAPSAATTFPMGLTPQKALDYIVVCENALDRATVFEYFGTAAQSASLVELARAIPITALLRSTNGNVVNYESVEDDDNNNDIKSLSLFALRLKTERLRLLKKAVLVGSSHGASATGASVKSLWEVASAICAWEQEVEVAENECKDRLVAVLTESPSHMFATELWRKLYQNSSFLPVPGAGAPLHYSVGNTTTITTTAAATATTTTTKCNHASLLELVRSTNFNEIPRILQSCVESLDGHTVFDWLNVQDQGTGQTAIMQASLNGNTELVRLLCSFKAVNLKIGENLGFLPVDGAAFAGHPEVLRLLIGDPSCSRDVADAADAADAAFAEPPLWDRPSPVDGYTPLWRAVWGSTPSHVEAVSVLLKEGKANPDFPCGPACGGPHTTMLGYAVAMGNAKTVQLLLDHGATVSDAVKEQVASRVSQATDSVKDSIASLFHAAVVEHEGVEFDDDEDDDEAWMEDSSSSSFHVDVGGDTWEDDE